MRSETFETETRPETFETETKTFCFTSPHTVRPREASDSVSTIRDVMPLTVELAVRFSFRTQCKRCSTGAYIASFPKEVGPRLAKMDLEASLETETKSRDSISVYPTAHT